MRRSLRSACLSVGGRAVAASLLAVAACDSHFLTEDDLTVDLVLLSAPEVLAVGERGQATAQALGTNGLLITYSKLQPRFSSRDASVATVDAVSGVVTGVAPGRAVLAAESRGQVAIDTVVGVAR